MAEVVGLERIIERIYMKEWTVDTTIRAQEAIPARIDRLPVSREIWGIMLLAGVAGRVIRCRRHWQRASITQAMYGLLLPSTCQEELLENPSALRR
jgi:hypothetical protein